jgi:SAM-dependent methyltransferase
MIYKLLENVLFSLARPVVVKRDQSLTLRTSSPTLGVDQVSATNADKHGAGANPTTFLSEEYFGWRSRELTQQFEDHFSTSDVVEKDILDYGCRSGFPSKIIAGKGARSVHGIDLNVADIEFAKNALKPAHGAAQPTFQVAGDLIRIDASNNAFDVIVCFDVFEHISHYREVLREWLRVLRPAGKILIWWQPYLYPYGHHLMSYLPLPWVHAVFPSQVLANACNRVFLMPEYRARFWEIDANGNKKLDRLFTKETILGDLNKLTISDFEKVCRNAGFNIVRAESHFFGNGGIVAAVSKALCKVPFFREFFTAYMIYELEKPSDPSPTLSGPSTGRGAV